MELNGIAFRYMTIADLITTCNKMGIPHTAELRVITAPTSHSFMKKVSNGEKSSTFELENEVVLVTKNNTLYIRGW